MFYSVRCERNHDQETRSPRQSQDKVAYTIAIGLDERPKALGAGLDVVGGGIGDAA